MNPFSAHAETLLRVPDLVLVTDEEQTVRLTNTLGSREYMGPGILVTTEPGQPGGTLAVGLRAPQRAVRRLQFRWNLPLPEATHFLGDHWERGYGDLEWRGSVPERKMPWYFIAHSAGASWGVGVETGAAAICWWQIDAEGLSLFADVSNGGCGVLLGDRGLSVCLLKHVMAAADETPLQAASALCRVLCPAPRPPAHPVYGGNDWYYAYGKNSADTIRRDAALIAELSPAGIANRPYMVIDAGWFPAAGCDGGPYERGNDRFPNMPDLAADMTGLGTRPGIWIRPLLTSEAPDTWQLPPAHPVRKRDRGIFLDPSVPEVLDLVRNDIRRLSGWGYQLIKHDFTTYDIFGRWGFEMTDSLTASGWSFADRSRTTAEIIHDLYKAIREGAGDDTVIIGCNTVGHLGAGLFELQRTGDDTSGREWERTRKMGVNTLAFRMPQHNTFFAADADCVGLTNQVPWHLNRQWLDLLARSGTPLFVSASPDAVGPEQKAALKAAFARAAVPQEPAEPLDWLHTTCPRHWRSGEGETISYRWNEET